MAKTIRVVLDLLFTDDFGLPVDMPIQQGLELLSNDLVVQSDWKIDEKVSTCKTAKVFRIQSVEGR